MQVSESLGIWEVEPSKMAIESAKVRGFLPSDMAISRDVGGVAPLVEPSLKMFLSNL